MPKADLVLLHAPSVYDFRKESILYGPVSDLVPSTPVFELYPIGFTTIAEYLERRGFRVRIVNLAVRMLNEPRFDAEKFLRSLDPLAFGVDLHWLPHAQGALEVASLVKRHHPHTPVIFGGFSATYYHEELINYPQVDYVVRGDSTEEPMGQLMRCIQEGRQPGQVPNLTWRDSQGAVHVNPLSHVPDDLDYVLLDYSYVVRAVARYRDLASFVPFQHWLDYPITAALTCRGCTHNCRTCGGSAQAFREFHGRKKTAYRSPENLAQDIRNIGRFSNGPVIILGDIRQPGLDYAERFLEAMKGTNKQVIMEIFGPASRSFIQQVATTFPGFTLEISPESHSEEVRKAFGRSYSNCDLEATLEYALEAGCHRLDVFFMVGLPRQDYQSVMDTVEYCDYLMQRFNAGDSKRLFPFISPLAPFLDPGSLVFENPEAYGYRFFYRTLEEHRRALMQPSWKYVLNYETQWMNRDQIVASTYQAGLGLNRLKARYGLVDPALAEITERRIRQAMELIDRVDEIMEIADEDERQSLLTALKATIDGASLSTVCDKRELELPVGRLLKLNVPKVALFFLGDLWAKVRTLSGGIRGGGVGQAKRPVPDR